ncbi:hypothetical protein P8452_36227 [Trifolium repens]|nr:hypothetical protein P8452_36227 [Trifolium repens]
MRLRRGRAAAANGVGTGWVEKGRRGCFLIQQCHLFSFHHRQLFSLFPSIFFCVRLLCGFVSGFCLLKKNLFHSGRYKKFKLFSHL